MTKARFSPFLGFAVLAGSLMIAQDTFCLPFIDTINYTNGNLGGQLNPENSAWTPMGTNTAGAADILITNVTLSYPGLECNATNAVQFGNLGLTERVAISPAAGANPFAFTTGTIYYSYVFQMVNSGTLTTGGAFVSAFTTVVGPSATQPTVGGARLYVRLNPDGETYTLGIGKNPVAPATVSWASKSFSPSDTNFIVASYTYVPGGTTNDFAQLWINPDPATFGAAVPPPADLTNMTTDTDVLVAGNNQIESFYFRQGNALIPIIQASNLRLGFCWGCVTPPSGVTTPPRNTLTIASAGTNSVVSWSTNTPCFSLQSAQTVNSTNWTTLQGNFGTTPTTNAFLYTNAINITTNTNSTKLFYRLKATAN